MNYHINQLLKDAAGHLNWSQGKIADFTKPNHIHEFEIKLADKSYPAYRVQHNNKNGPYKGGVRYHPSVGLDEATALAQLMTLKTAATNLPLGGGKGGIKIDPKSLNHDQLEDISRQYVRGLYEVIGPDQDIPAPDMNTSSHTMDWMVDEYEQLAGDKSKASFTGKSIQKGGSHGRTEATGQGGVFALQTYIDSVAKSSKPLTVAVQGFGNVGSHFADILSRDDRFRIVAVSDAKTAIRMKDLSIGELNIEGVKKCKRETSVCSGYISKHDGAGKVIEIPRDDLLVQDVDILVLAAIENAVNDSNVQSVTSKILLELANGPVSHEAYLMLIDNNVVIIPDLIANSGGVVVSYFEWLQNKQSESWSKEDVAKKLKQKMIQATKDTLEVSSQENKSLKQAAYINALQKFN